MGNGVSGDQGTSHPVAKEMQERRLTGNSMTGQSKPGHRKSIRCRQRQTLTYA